MQGLRGSLAAAWLTLAGMATSLAAEEPPPADAGPVRVDAALVTLIDQVEVPARQAGVLASVLAREGQTVAAGQVLAQIDDTEARLDQTRAELELELARHEADNDVRVRFAGKSRQVADAELQRALDSVARYNKSISDTELDRLKLAAERAALELEQAELERDTAQLTARLKHTALEAAQRLVERHRLAAPTDAVVVQVLRRAGEWVEPGQSVVRVVGIERLRVEGFVDGQQLSDDWHNRPVTLEVDLPGAPATRFAGRVVFVSPEINPVNGQARVWAEVENRNRQLRPGLSGTLWIAPAPAPAGAD